MIHVLYKQIFFKNKKNTVLKCIGILKHVDSYWYTEI